MSKETKGPKEIVTSETKLWSEERNTIPSDTVGVDDHGQTVATLSHFTFSDPNHSEDCDMFNAVIHLIKSVSQKSE
jgi:hypothetical protein